MCSDPDHIQRCIIGFLTEMIPRGTKMNFMKCVKFPKDVYAMIMNSAACA